MMNKKKLCIIIVIAIIVTGLAVTFAVLSKSGKHKENVNEETTVNNEKQTDSVIRDLAIKGASISNLNTFSEKRSLLMILFII